MTHNLQMKKQNNYYNSMKIKRQSKWVRRTWWILISPIYRRWFPRRSLLMSSLQAWYRMIRKTTCSSAKTPKPLPPNTTLLKSNRKIFQCNISRVLQCAISRVASLMQDQKFLRIDSVTKVVMHKVRKNILSRPSSKVKRRPVQLQVLSRRQGLHSFRSRPLRVAPQRCQLSLLFSQLYRLLKLSIPSQARIWRSTGRR